MTAEYRTPEGVMRPKWDDRGIDEIRAAVVRCAWEDYTEACKIILAYRMTDNHGRNLTRLRQKIDVQVNYLARTKDVAEGRKAAKLDSALAMRDECERFFRSQWFYHFLDSVDGVDILRKAQHVVFDWAFDKRKTTFLWHH